MFHTFVVALLAVLTLQLLNLSRAVSEIYISGIGLISTNILWFFPLPFLLISILWGFWYSNRIVGPLFNLQRHLEKTLSGETLAPARCRKSDLFKELFDVVNRLLDTKKLPSGTGAHADSE
jgi:hypothetical protein